MYNCLDIVQNKYDIKGYSWDLIQELKSAKGSEDECLALFSFLETRYG